MPKGKPWTIEEERRPRELVEQKANVKMVTAALGKTRDAVIKKTNRLELVVVDATKTKKTTTSSLRLPEELPSIEETLELLTAALKALERPGLEQSEVLRLRSVIQDVKTYKELFTDYVDYRGIETDLVEMMKALEEMREAYERLTKKPRTMRPNQLTLERTKAEAPAMHNFL